MVCRVKFALVLLAISVAVSRAEEDAAKCCGPKEILMKADDSDDYRCTEDTKKRLTILANHTAFLATKTDGRCIEVLDDSLFAFTIQAGKFSQQTPLTTPITKKCCPPGFVYHPQVHSCVETNLDDAEDVHSVVVRVGLAHCRLIVDYEGNEGVSRGGFDFCVDRTTMGGVVRRECREDEEVCGGLRCVKKCCPDGQSYVGGRNCVDTYVHGVDLGFSTSIEDPLGPFAVILNETCKRIYIMDENRYTFNLMKDGRFRYWQNFTNSYINESIYSQNSYCIEHSDKKGKQAFFVFKCFPDNEVKEKFIFSRWPKIVSCVFLALTILIYLLLNETRTIFGKILMNYCIGTLFMFSLLTYSHHNLKPSDNFCELIGYGLIFFSSVSFAWLNVMCCDIWFTFGSTKQSVGLYQRRKDFKKFLGYTLYGWGMPAVLTLIIYTFSRSKILPYAIHPYVGSTLCFIESRTGNYAPTIFLRLPHFLIQIVNTVLFFKTITYCLRIKNEINKINDTTKYEKKHRFKKDKERLSLVLKLSVIMGLGFIFETISGFVVMSELGPVPKYIEIIWDCFNCLQGLFIFIIFICKRKILNSILIKLNLKKNDVFLNNSRFLSTTSTTRISLKNGINELH